MFSDLTFLLDGKLGKRKVILGGDFNASLQWDKQQPGESHRIMFERLENFGLVSCIDLFLEKISKYLTKQYKEDLYKVIFDVYSQILKEKAYDEDEIDEIVSYSKIGDFFFGQEEEWMESATNFINFLISKEITDKHKRKWVKEHIGKK